MEASGKLLSSRLLSLLKNGKWEDDDVVELFKALVKDFNGRSEDFHTWMMTILHQVEIHKISVSDLTLNDNKIVDHVKAKINKIVMMGKTPDIISSSPVLAERDAKEWSAFYNELNITVDANTNKSNDNELKKCYECQVVYGTTDSFAGDFLRQQFHRRDVRPEREFQCVIVDEMKCLDTGEILGHIQLFSQVLSEIMHGSKNINQLSIVQTTVDAGIMPLRPMQVEENMTNVLKRLDTASVVQMVAFLTMFVGNFPEYFIKLYQQAPDGTLRKLNEINPTGANNRQEISILLLGNGKCRVVHSDEDSLVTSLGKSIQMVYQSESTGEQTESRIPGLQDLVNGKVQTWIESALQATKMTLGHEYILHGDGVAPVDYRSTGIVQNNMKWGEGLQQFLEMKHQTKLSNMSLITNFMSNVGLFKKYKEQIYGITGTLRDQSELEMVKQLYNGIDTCKIPSFKRRKLYELEGVIVPEEDEWIKTVCDVVQDQVTSTVYRGPRAALVICETINRAIQFHTALANNISSEKLNSYVNNNMDNSAITDTTVQAGNVIIATNLAGRGTDLKVSESVNEAGGLFVVQTFLPLNIRVEQQAFGRTARQGSPGSAQLIMCASHFSDSIKLVMGLNTSLTSLLGHLNHLKSLLTTKSKTFMASNLEEAKDARNIMVNIRLSRFLEKDIPKILKEEELFSVYLDILDDVYEDNVFSDQRDVIVSCLHECWGLWLLMHFSEEKPIDMLKKQLKMDLLIAKQKLLSKQSPSSMVYYYIRTGNNLREKGRLAESIEMYTKALENGASGKIIPLYNRALATITKKNTGYIAQALTDLENADKAIDSFKSHLAHIIACVKLSRQEQTTEGDAMLLKQFRVKSMIVDVLKMNIQDAVMKLKRAENMGGDVSLTQKHPLFLAAHIMLSFPRLLDDLVMETVHIISLGLEDIFSLDTIFSASGLLSKVFKIMKYGKVFKNI
ncbi:hypothetical protein PO909_024939 [Leuciscus waleckii]